jgi:uncharacterized lipoprotein YddW (UPF0748 family)
MFFRPLPVFISALTILALAAGAQPLRVQPIERTTTGGTVRGYVAVVDLCAPGVEVVVTAPLPAGSTVEANLVRTDTWQTSTGVTLAVNANYFATVTGGADVVGLHMSDGVIVSPVRTFNGASDPALIFKNDCTAEIGNITSAMLSNVVDAVAGVGPSTTDTIPGTLLVTDGRNTGLTARVEPTVRNPRTAVGINQAGNQLYIVVIDGRQSGWSVGMTLAELGDFMIERGAHRALNLDGGGSSAFVYQPVAGGTRTLNRPSDGNFRAVSTNLGIRIPPQPAALSRRPIKGVWLRPPTTIAALEAQLNLYAQSGIQDLYLETFYWGLSTGSAGTFNARFAFNYLDQAIKAAAKYNIRVHAWCESAYWQYTTAGQYLFTANPEYRALNVATGGFGGDGTAGQVFSNLANPGVQAKMRAYFGELANYTGLWGIQTDYHRYPLDNNTSDSFTAPWGYDQWARTAFQTIYGVDPLTGADTPSDVLWGPFLAFRRNGLSQAANQMHQGINAVNSGIDFSSAMFATAMSSSAQLTKCQDWPTWATNDYIETLIPMAYGSTVASIQNDLNITKTSAAGKRVVAGLAIINPASRPIIQDQLIGIKAVGIDSYVLFEGTMLSDAANRFQLLTFHTDPANAQRGDFNNDGYVDSRDRVLLNGTYTGTPLNVNNNNRKYDLNSDNIINATDVTLFNRYFAKFRFGEDGVVDQRDIDAVRACFGQVPVVSGVQHLYDLDGDSDVDYNDQVVLHGLLTSVLAPDLDVDRNGRVTIDDQFAQERVPIDVNRDGTIDGLDTTTLENFLRGAETSDLLTRP